MYMQSDENLTPIEIKSKTCEGGGAHLGISVWDLLMNLKNNYLLKKLLKWANKKYTKSTKCAMIMIICYTVPEIWGVTDVIFIFHFGLFFAFSPS